MHESNHGPIPDGCIPGMEFGHDGWRHQLLHTAIGYTENGQVSGMRGIIGGLTLHERNHLLYYSVFYSDCVELVLDLLSFGAQPSAWDWESRNQPIHMAALFGRVGVVRALLHAGADPKARAADGRTPLHALARCSGRKMPTMAFAAGDRLGVLGVLLAHGADINARDVEGHTPLSLIRPIADWSWARQWKLRGAHL